jgi:hypothetical protein
MKACHAGFAAAGSLLLLPSCSTPPLDPLAMPDQQRFEEQMAGYDNHLNRTTAEQLNDAAKSDSMRSDKTK